MTAYYSDDLVSLYVGDCREVLAGLPAESVDAAVTDPPYHLTPGKASGEIGHPSWNGATKVDRGRKKAGFMGKAWDGGDVAMDPETWRAVLRVAKPGAHLLAFGGTRTYHRLVCAIEDAGWEIRDTVMWVYGSGFPKSLDVSKAIDKRGGAEIGWFGPWLRMERERRGITQKDLAGRGQFYGAVNHGGAVANWELGLNLPTAEQFNKLCEVLDLPFDRIEEAEREVIGGQTKARSEAGRSALPTLGAAVKYETWDVTAPATDAAKQWAGWGTALKPAWEPVTIARKPLVGTVAGNVQQYGTGALNIDASRIPGAPPSVPQPSFNSPTGRTYGMKTGEGRNGEMSAAAGRWPANLIHDGSEEVLRCFPESESGANPTRRGAGFFERYGGQENAHAPRGAEAGSAARFFYCAKADKGDRFSEAGNDHPTVKPLDLMRYLIRLVTPPGGLVLDPFAGSGSTIVAARDLGFRSIGIDLEERHCQIAAARLNQGTLDFGGAA